MKKKIILLLLLIILLFPFDWNERELGIRQHNAEDTYPWTEYDSLFINVWHHSHPSYDTTRMYLPGIEGPRLLFQRNVWGNKSLDFIILGKTCVNCYFSQEFTFQLRWDKAPAPFYYKKGFHTDGCWVDETYCVIDGYMEGGLFEKK